MRTACVIPARLKSTRFPRKMLMHLQGKPLLQWVWEAAVKTDRFDTVCFAVDALETAELVRSFGGTVFMTSESCLSGTERLMELQRRELVHADVWVNWQGDEPFLSAQMIDDLLQTAGKDGSDLWTLKKKIVSPEEIQSIHFAKVVCNAAGHALYFSRSPIPCYRDPCPGESQKYYKHVGVYAFADQTLRLLGSLSPCELESAEQLEQLRFLHHGLKIRVHETQTEVIGIDLPEHLAKAEAYAANLNIS